LLTDDTLVQSIGELRRVLGDEGPRLSPFLGAKRTSPSDR